MAYLPAHLLDLVEGQRRGHQDGAGLLRHATVKMTLEVYAQAVTPAKRKAQSKVAEMLQAGTGVK